MLRLRSFLIGLFILNLQIGHADNCNDEINAIDKKSFSSQQRKKAEVLSLIAKYQGNDDCLAKLYLRLGILLQAAGKQDSAILVYSSAAKIFELEHENVGLASCFNQMATVYVGLENDSMSLVYYKKAYNLFTKEKYIPGKAVAALNIAEVYYQEDSLKLAEDYCLISIACSRLEKDSANLGMHYSLLAYIFFDQKQIVRAHKYADKARAIFLLSKDDMARMQGLNRLGVLYLDLGLKEQGLQYLRESLALATKNENKRMMAEGARALAEFYETEKRYDSAYVYFQKYADYKDVMASENMQAAIANSSIEYETEKKELEYQNELKQKKNSQILNAVFAIVSVLLILTIFFLVRNFAQKREIQKRETELNSAKALMEGQEGERERIAHELHDRVGSMISTIKLQLGVIEHFFKSKNKQQEQMMVNVHNLIDETYEEVRRISHDLDSGQLGKIGLHAAMQKLAKGIAVTRQLKVSYIDSGLSETIAPTVETDLYRITQELLTNTIKYAHASEVSIQVSTSEGKVLYSYEDDGDGFDKDTLKEAAGIGYKNINARVVRMTGKWFIETSPGNGTNVIIEIPIT